MARRAAAATITHFAQDSGHQNTVNTTIPRAKRKRQKHKLMILSSFKKTFRHHMKKSVSFQALKLITSSIEFTYSTSKKIYFIIPKDTSTNMGPFKRPWINIPTEVFFVLCTA